MAIFQFSYKEFFFSNLPCLHLTNTKDVESYDLSFEIKKKCNYTFEKKNSRYFTTSECMNTFFRI